MRPIKNKKRRDPRYFLNENIDSEDKSINEVGMPARKTTSPYYSKSSVEQQPGRMEFDEEGEKVPYAQQPGTSPATELPKALQSVMRSSRGPLAAALNNLLSKNFQDISLGDLQNAQAAYEKLSQRYGSVKEWTRHFDDAVDGLAGVHKLVAALQGALQGLSDQPEMGEKMPIPGE